MAAGQRELEPLGAGGEGGDGEMKHRRRIDQPFKVVRYSERNLLRRQPHDSLGDELRCDYQQPEEFRLAASKDFSVALPASWARDPINSHIILIMSEIKISKSIDIVLNERLNYPRENKHPHSVP